jgi:hypothetical protein
VVRGSAARLRTSKTGSRKGEQSTISVAKSAHPASQAKGQAELYAA